MAEVTEGVWVASARLAELPASSHPADLAASAGMTSHRATEFLASRGLLRDVLTQTTPRAAGAEVAIRVGGKPYLRGHDAVGISVSHDGGRVAVCVATGREVGVDLQHPNETVGAGLLRRCLGRYADAVTELSTRDAAAELAWVWTVQEACVKASGAGFAGRPWTVAVPPGRATGSWGPWRWVSLRGRSAVPLSCAFSG
jgi:4'-phosphopantetheinyl transferase